MKLYTKYKMHLVQHIAKSSHQYLGKRIDHSLVKN